MLIILFAQWPIWLLLSLSLPLFTYREFDQYQSSRRPTLTPTDRENNFTVYCLSRLFTAAAGCNCLVYTLSLNTPSESLRHWSSRDNTTVCCISWHWVRIVSSVCLGCRLQWEWDQRRRVTPTRGLCLRLRRWCGDTSPRSHCHSPNSGTQISSPVWHNKASLAPGTTISRCVNNQLYDCAKSGANVQTINNLAV